MDNFLLEELLSGMAEVDLQFHEKHKNKYDKTPCYDDNEFRGFVKWVGFQHRSKGITPPYSPGHLLDRSVKYGTHKAFPTWDSYGKDLKPIPKKLLAEAIEKYNAEDKSWEKDKYSGGLIFGELPKIEGGKIEPPSKLQRTNSMKVTKKEKDDPQNELLAPLVAPKANNPQPIPSAPRTNVIHPQPTSEDTETNSMMLRKPKRTVPKSSGKPKSMLPKPSIDTEWPKPGQGGSGKKRRRRRRNSPQNTSKRKQNRSKK